MLRDWVQREEGNTVQGLIASILGMFTDKEGEFRRQGKTLYDVFHQHDADKDGVLTKNEFHEALAARPFSLKFADREKLHR